ncbi:uncharacterized protein BYT42DRAFT_498577 [Radiomyces spectabilis]|uniref:uncharacterized protein n=1 Tax=Radiomyces spectabilis TaxID=64574 RepID=UPI00221F33D4|nr:uncharacterized protein BYT42DRAFT_498577 [Radiomyces spectabilis]KAI8376416.1 hypothetical protein BYT42DRAFT_498577 [Radiomyces spectabilis]
MKLSSLKCRASSTVNTPVDPPSAITSNPAVASIDPFHHQSGCRSPSALCNQRTENKDSYSFSETLRMISKEAQSGMYEDVFGAFFFNDKRCQNRAFFMAARIKQTLSMFFSIPSTKPSLSLSTITLSADEMNAVWEMITNRLYTLNYLLFVLSPTCHIRNQFLSQLEYQLSQIGDGQNLHRRGGMEAHIAVRYALQHLSRRRRRSSVRGCNQNYDEEEIEDLVERARQVLEHCLQSESKLGHSERDAMYVFHGMRVGLHGSFEPKIELEENAQVERMLNEAVYTNKEFSKSTYVNPFEDDAAIVVEDDDDYAFTSIRSMSREVDSGFGDIHDTALSKAF